MRYGDTTNLHGRGRYRNVGRKYPKEKIHSENKSLKRRTQTKYTEETWIWLCGWQLFGLGLFSVLRFKNFILQKRREFVSNFVNSELHCSINKGVYISLITKPKHLMLQKTYN
jgi:hypothetical protein